MPKYLDSRDYSYVRQGGGEALRARLENSLPARRGFWVERTNPYTGAAAALHAVSTSSRTGDRASLRITDLELINLALEQLQLLLPALGFAPGESFEFVPDARVKKTAMGWRAINIKQYYRGIPLFEMERVLVFDEAGILQYSVGNNVGDLSPGHETAPSVTVETAASAAAKYLAQPDVYTDSWTSRESAQPAFALGDYEPQILGRITTATQAMVLEPGPFREAIPAQLVFFYQGAAIRLGWQFLISMPRMGEQYRLIIAADSRTPNPDNPELLYCHKTTCEMAAPVKGNVWLQHPEATGQRQLIDFPRPLSDYPITPLPTGLPAGFPFPWIDDTAETSGNNVLSSFAQTGATIRGSVENGFLTFNPSHEESPEQAVLNAFYFCNFMHDFFCLLGFDEEAGNFQRLNFTGQGRRGDELRVAVELGEIDMTAVLETGADGTRTFMTLGLVSASNRHTALDSDIVFHEYTHGVTKRLVGSHGDDHPLEQGQSAGLGEGWSDYFALTAQNFFLNQEKTVIGDWVFDKSGGKRLAKYDDNYPGTFGQIGKPGNYLGVDERGNPTPHPLGEIWCAALMKMNRDLGQVFGNKRHGHLFGWQLVIDGLKLLPASPSFLDARDTILKALKSREQTLSVAMFAQAQQAVRNAFVKFGMGQNASCVGASLVNIVEDRALPPHFD
ncbi:MAG: M36 family metallopeptidase [Acidobacteria bacterium]|nr:M36 family metallopeptidase [Acidobacteriota bacterium]MBI3428303.1 M36 family metallopeptidase [Acidobacteriota bacterium]